jgi:hypothetical protein
LPASLVDFSLPNSALRFDRLITPVTTVQPSRRDLRKFRILPNSRRGIALSPGNELISRGFSIFEHSLEGLPGGDLSLAPWIRFPPLAEW